MIWGPACKAGPSTLSGVVSEAAKEPRVIRSSCSLVTHAEPYDLYLSLRSGQAARGEVPP